MSPDKRVFILTRSGFAGLQRHAAAIWSGDIVSRWDDLHEQISAGLSVGYSGRPNWTFDIGGFANEGRYSTRTRAADLEEWRELNMRWFQFGAFLPLFRSHGQFPYREIYNLAPEGSEVLRHARLTQAALPTDAVHLHAGGGYVSPRRHHDARAGDGLPDDLEGARYSRPVHVREGVPGRPGLPVQGAQPQVYLPGGADWNDFQSGAKTTAAAHRRRGRR